MNTIERIRKFLQKQKFKNVRLAVDERIPITWHHYKTGDVHGNVVPYCLSLKNDVILFMYRFDTSEDTVDFGIFWFDEPLEEFMQKREVTPEQIANLIVPWEQFDDYVKTGKYVSPLKNYSWAEICNNAAGKPHLSPELKAKDEARYQANQYAMEHGEPDAESFDCPEEQIEYYCDKFNLFFDINGNIITV